MRILSFIFLILISTNTVNAQICSKSQLPTNLQNGLVAFYPFCGNANDASGNGNNGTSNNITYGNDRFGNANSTGVFTKANSSYFFYPASPQFQPTSFTLSTWFNTSIIQTGGLGSEKDQFIAGYSSLNWTIAGPSYKLWLDVVNNADLIARMWTSATSWQEIKASSAISTNIWFHAVLVYDGLLKTESLYLNGVLIKTISANLEFQNQSGFYIGASRENATGVIGSFFDGRIDDVGFWNRPLSNCEITQLYNSTSSNVPQIQVAQINSLSDTTKVCGSSTILDAGTGFSSYSWNTGATTQTINPTTSGFYKVTVTNSTGCSASDSTYLSLVKAKIIQRDTTICKGSTIKLSIDSTLISNPTTSLTSNLRNGLVAYYPFNGNANDESGNGNHGTINGARLTSDRFSNTNRSFSFNGVSDWIAVKDNSVLNPATSISISLWISTNSVHNNNGIIGKWNNFNGVSANGQEQYVMYAGPNTQGIRFYTVTNLSSAVVDENKGAKYNDGAWHHYLSTWDGTTMKLFRDGLVIDSVTQKGTLKSFNQGLEIGRYAGGSGTGTNVNYYNGKIDDIAIWNRALTDSEVLTLYRNQSISWSTGATSNSITVSPTQTTKYYVTVSDGITSCKDSITVTVSDIGNFNPLQDTIRVCGDSAILDAGAGYSVYNWNNGAKTQKIIVKSGGKYLVNVTNASGCTAADSTLVSIVKAKIIQRDTTICKGYSITLSVDSTSIGTTACNSTELPSNLQNGLVAYYPFCGNANDASVNGNNGKINVAYLNSDRNNKSNSSYTFQGNSSIKISNSSSIGSDINTEITISCWVKLNSYFNGRDSTFSPLVSKNGPFWHQYNLFIGNGLIGFWGPGIYDSQNADIKLNKWMNIVVTFSSGKISYYLDGNLISTKSQTQTNLSHFSNADLEIGINSPNQIEYLDGSIDDIFIYKRALSSNEIILLYSTDKSINWSTGSKLNSITITPTQTTKYYVTVSDGITSCKDSITVTVSDIGNFNPLQDTIRVCGDSVVLDAGAGYSTYNWSNGAKTQKITVKSGGKYVVNVTNASGCSAADSTLVSIVKAKIIQLDTTICKGSSITLSIDSTSIGTKVCNSTQLPANLQNGLVAYYPFCGNANDASGNGNNGVVNGATLASDRFGNNNSSFYFKSDTQSINCGNSPSLGLNTNTKLSLLFWTKSINNKWPYISKYQHLFPSNSNYGVGNSKQNYFVTGNGQNGWSFVPNNVSDWNHMCFIFDGTKDSVSIYVNGLFKERQFLLFSNLISNRDLIFGPRFNPDPNAYDIPDGFLDDVFIYNKALNSVEINQIIKLGSSNINWSTGSSSNSIAISPTQTTKYYLTVSDGITSCQDSITVTVASIDTSLTVLDNPDICSNGGTVRLQAKAGAAAYQWKRNGVNITGANSALYTVTQTGNYYVVLTGTANCKDSSRTVAINISPVPIPDFTINTLNQCLSINNYSFTNISSISAGTMSYNWSFGNGVTSSSVSPTYAYPAAGSFTVKLLATSDKNCKDSVSKSVTIYPMADTTLNLLDAAISCANVGTRLKLNDNVSYKWLRDGLPISGATTNQYAALQAGVYRAVVTSIDGCSDSTRSVNIGINPLPVANFTINNTSQCLNENGFLFTNTSSINTGTILYKWDLGEGSTSNTTSPSKKFVNSGTYNIKLVSTSDKLCSDSITKQVIVLVDADSSIAVLDPAEICASGGSVRIQAGNATSYRWIKDGVVISGAGSSLFSATQTGNYQVIVSTAQGCSDTSRIVNIKLNPQPVPNFTINNNAQCLTENGFIFTNTSSISSGSLTYSWTFGDGTNSTTSSPSKSFLVAGVYSVKLIATSDKRCTDSITKQLTVYPQPPMPVITGPDEFCKGSSIILQSNGSPVLNWYKNDVLLTGETLASLRITQGGNYKVISTNNNGCKSSSLVKAVIENPLPVGTFNTPATLNICEGSSLTLSASGASTYQWFYNNNPILGATIATYNAKAAGTYSVDFISNKGCLAKGITTHTLLLLKKPVANFIYDTYCAGIQTNFSSKSIITQSGLVRYFWQFGDGKISSNGQNAFNTYSNAGNYRAKLIVTPVECPQLADSAEALIAVENRPAGIAYPPVNAIINRAQQLTARNIGITYQWTPSSYLTSSTSRTPTITTSKEQLYFIYIKNQAGCNIVDTQLVRVFPDRNIYVPEGFTPDNDGHNDRLYPILVGISEMRVFKIFNRWGTLVFDNKNATVNTGWNGTFQGRTQPMDTYAWVAEGIDVDGKLVTRTGNTILIR